MKRRILSTGAQTKPEKVPQRPQGPPPWNMSVRACIPPEIAVDLGEGDHLRTYAKFARTYRKIGPELNISQAKQLFKDGAEREAFERYCVVSARHEGGLLALLQSGAPIYEGMEYNLHGTDGNWSSYIAGFEVTVLEQHRTILYEVHFGPSDLSTLATDGDEIQL